MSTDFDGYGNQGVPGDVLFSMSQKPVISGAYVTEYLPTLGRRELLYQHDHEPSRKLTGARLGFFGAGAGVDSMDWACAAEIESAKSAVAASAKMERI
jgi:hypothetical protein